jgi:hypothetical protein
MISKAENQRSALNDQGLIFSKLKCSALRRCDEGQVGSRDRSNAATNFPPLADRGAARLVGDATFQLRVFDISPFIFRLMIRLQSRANNVT